MQSASARCDYAVTDEVKNVATLTALVDTASLGQPGALNKMFLRPTALGVTDGLSNTIFVLEKGGCTEHWQLGKVIPQSSPAGSGKQNPSSWGWSHPSNDFGTAGTDPITGASGGSLSINGDNNDTYSFHTSGANVTFGDGSVRFVSTGLNIRFWARLVTARAG